MGVAPVGVAGVVVVVGPNGFAVVGTVGAVMVRGGGGCKSGGGGVEKGLGGVTSFPGIAEPPEGTSRFPPTIPVNGDAASSTVEPMIASATILTNDPDALLVKEMLLTPSAPNMIVWVELNSNTDRFPRASRTSPGELVKRRQLTESLGPSRRVLLTCKVPKCNGQHVSPDGWSVTCDKLQELTCEPNRWTMCKYGLGCRYCSTC